MTETVSERNEKSISAIAWQLAVEAELHSSLRSTTHRMAKDFEDTLSGLVPATALEAAQSEAAFYRAAGIAEIAAVNPRVMEYMTHWEGRVEAARARIAELEAERDEARRRRDEWRKKAEGYDAVRLALREKVGAPWPPSLSRALWAGIAADEKKRADDAEAALATARREALEEAAKVADDHLPKDMWESRDSSTQYNSACRDIAKAVRALMEKPNG